MRVLVSVPTKGMIHKGVVYALLKLVQDRRHKLRIILPSHSPVEINRHHIINDFMGGVEDFWLSVDSDNPPLKNPLDLIDLNKDIIGCPTPVWHYTGKNGERPIYWNAYRKKGDEGYNEWMPREGLQEVDAIGSGCMLVARRVFESQRMREGAFNPSLKIDGTLERGDDMMFCERAKSEGFRVWAHYDYPCQHFTQGLELNEVVKAFKGLGVK